MSIQVADNFSYQGAKPLDARLKYNTVADMVAVGASTIYDGILAYVTATKTYYTYDSTNDVDVTLGKWRELETGGGASITWGYYKEADGKFYEESTYTTEITGVAGQLYGTLDTSELYSFDGTDFVLMSGYVPQDIIEGYYDAGRFYEDAAHTTEITGQAETLYIAVDTSKLYRFNGTDFVIVGADIDTVVYTPAGSIPFANLPVLSANVLGYIYNITDDFTTTSDFVEGAGHDYPEGSNVGVVNVGTTAVPSYKFDVFSGIIDLSKYLEKVSTAPSTPSNGDIILYTGTVAGDFTDSPGVYVYDGTNWILQDLGIKGQIIQVSTLPTASVSELGKIYQYTGASIASSYTHGYFYECVEDSTTTPSTYSWEAVQVQEGGSGGGSLGKAITAAIDVGGIDSGDSFAIGTSYDDMWDALLNPTLYPTFTNPSATLSYSADTYYEVGTSIPAKSATVSLNRGTITPAYGTSGYRSGAATNYALASSGADTEYSDSSASSGSFSVPALTRATKGNIVLTATVSYAAGEQPKDSKGNNYDSPLAAGSKSTTKTMQFIQPYYYGKSATSTVSDFTGLTKSVTAKGQKQFKFTTNNEHMVMAYDSSYGNLSSIIDPNGFETISGWTKSTLTVGGFSYYVYVANSATTDTNAQFTFKY